MKKLFTLLILLVAVVTTNAATVYVKDNNHSTLNIYYWGGSSSAAWPGNAMTQRWDANGNTWFYYEVPSKITAYIINCNGSPQTGDQSSIPTADIAYDFSTFPSNSTSWTTTTIPTQLYTYDPTSVPTTMYILGNSFGAPQGTEMTQTESGVFSYDGTAASASGWFAFSEVSSTDWNAVNAKRYGPATNNTTATVNATTDVDGTGDTSFSLEKAGKYTYTFNWLTKKLTITGTPDDEAVVVNVRYTTDSWTSSTDEILTDNGDGTYSWTHTFDAAAELTFFDSNNQWYKSNNSAISYENHTDIPVNTTGSNFTIPAGTYAFTFDLTNKLLNVTGNFPAPVWTVVGDEALIGVDWSTSAEDNDMTTSDYENYTKTIEGKTLYAGHTFNYKVVKDHAWAEAYPEQNATLPITESGVYNITFSFNASTHAVSAEAVKQSAVNDYVDLQGAEELFGGTAWSTMFRMSTTDGTTYTYTIEDKVLAAQDYGYKAIVNQAWSAEGYVINNTLTISTAATYNVTITFNNSTKELTAVATPVVSWTVAGGLYDANAEAGQEFNHDAPGFVGANWDAANTDNDLTETSAGSGVWTKTYTGVPAGTYAFKVAYSHTLATAYPAANYEFTLTDASNVTVYYHETGNFVTIKVGDAWYDKWTVVGTVANVNGETAWAATETANDMTSTDGVNFALSVTGKTLYKGSATYVYKVVRNHAYGETYPSENASLPTVSESGVYTINYTFNAATKAVNAELVKTGVAYDYVDLQGAEALFGGTAWSTMFRMSSTDGTTYTYTIEDKVLAAQDYGYKAIVNDTWSEGYVINNTLTISTAATYNVTITFNNSTKELTAVATPVVSWTVAGCLNDGENEVDATGFFGTKWAATATANDLTETSAGSGVWTKTYTGVPAGNYEFKVAYSHTWDAASYPSQNIKLNIPAADATVVINFYDSDHTFSVTVNGEEKIARWVIAGGVSGDGTNAGFFNTAWNASDFTNKLTESSPGVWSKTYSDVPAGTYEFKVVESGTVWYGVPPSHTNYSVTVPDDGATLQFIWDGTTCTIENTATTWTIVGGPKDSAADLDDVLFTKTWDPTQTANDLEQTSTGYWTKTFSNVHLPVGIYEFKVATNHAWDESYPTGTTNESFEVKLEGDYDVTFEFYTSNKDLYGDITLKAADVDFYLAGTTFGWGTHNATNKFSIDNGLFVLEDVDLEMGAQFKLWDGADLWIGAQSDGNYWLNDTNKDNITMLSGDGENIYLAAAAGTYTVTFNPNTFKLSVAGTFGEPVKTLAFGATGYLTFGDLRNSFSFDGKGVDVYTVTYDADGMARRHAVESKQVPVGTGVLLYHTGGAGEVEIPIIGTPDALTDNNLHVSDGTVEGATNRYCLAADSTPLGVGFYPVAASVTIPAGKAYLQISNSSNAPARIWFDGETTAIDSLNGETGVENDGTVYDLNGRRVNGTLSRGLYIKNGKKFIVK